MSILPLLPMMEMVYNRRTIPSYKLARNSEKGTCVVAAIDIEGGAVVLIEKAIHVQPKQDHPSLLGEPEYQSLMATLENGEEKGLNVGVSCRPCHADSVSPKACKEAKNRLLELNTNAYVSTSPKKAEIWQLEDSHRQARVGDTVLIDGLASEAGKKLNGKHGHVSKQDEKDPTRLGVEITMLVGGRGGGTTNKNKKTVVRSIKPCNLKTLGGIMRTNAYKDPSTQNGSTVLFKDLCRVNHACGDAANVYRTIHLGKVYVTAKRDIQAGEEILVDYIPNEEGDRLGKLQEMFNFHCQCPAH